MLCAGCIVPLCSEASDCRIGCNCCYCFTVASLAPVCLRVSCFGSIAVLCCAVLCVQWVAQSVALPEQHLSGTINRLKAFNAKRKWRAVAAVVMMGARLGLKKRNRNGNEEARGEHGCESRDMRRQPENPCVASTYVTVFPSQPKAHILFSEK